MQLTTWDCHGAPLLDLDPESPTHTETRFCLSSGLPCQDPSRTHDSLLIFVDPIKHSVIKPGLKLQLLCLSEKLPITLCQFSLTDFDTFSSRRVHSKCIKQHLNVCHHLNYCCISDHHLLEQEATQILALDQSPSFADLFPQHEVAFPSIINCW